MFDHNQDFFNHTFLFGYNENFIARSLKASSSL